MKLRYILQLSFLVVLSLARADKPNVVVFLSDDQGWGDLSLHGNTNLRTPNIDSLGTDGATFDYFYVCPVCSPTRAEFLTGRYHQRGGVYSTSAGGERLDLDERTIAEVFGDAGYATGAFGKWHNGMQYPYHPVGRGFVEFYGFCSGHWGDYFSPPLEHNGRRVGGKGFVVDDFTEQAMAFMERHKSEPFFVYLPYNTPHSPWQAPDNVWEKFANATPEMTYRDPKREDIEKTRCALAMVENIDWNVGRVLEKLTDLGVADNTIVLYFNDNGPNSPRWNGGMKGRKGAVDEGGVRSPLVVRWPAKISAGTRIPQISGAIDLLPTLADCAGIEIGGGKSMDGITLKSLLLGKKDEWPERYIFSAWKNRSSVRSQRYRLDQHGALFDMENDLGQTQNVAGTQPEVKQKLAAALQRWNSEMSAETSAKDDRSFPVGFKAFPVTQLPARDGVPHGAIKRSNKFPNCSFFTNWVNQTDSITWDIEVENEGEYDAEVYYACAADDIGATIELRFKGHALQKKITVAHDPPLRGHENDRVKRVESYVKDFAKLDLGTIKLSKGRGLLKLGALQKPGNTVMEVRGIWLTLKNP